MTNALPQQINFIPDFCKEELEARRRQFLDDCAFAKVVDTYGGPALLIGGSVYQVISTSAHACEWLSEALRRPSTCCGEAEGSLSGFSQSETSDRPSPKPSLQGQEINPSGSDRSSLDQLASVSLKKPLSPSENSSSQDPSSFNMTAREIMVRNKGEVES